MTKTKITEKELYTLIKEAMADNADVVAFCDKKIGQLEAKAAKAKERAAEKTAAADELMIAVESLLTDDYQTTKDIMDQIEGEDITQYKVSYRLSQLVKNGVAEKAEVKIPGGEGTKARVVMGYKLAQ